MLRVFVFKNFEKQIQRELNVNHISKNWICSACIQNCLKRFQVNFYHEILNYHFFAVDSGDTSIDRNVQNGVVVFAVFSEAQSDASKLVSFSRGVD
jgi:hypothetical protein